MERFAPVASDRSRRLDWLLGGDDVWACRAAGKAERGARGGRGVRGVRAGVHWRGLANEQFQVPEVRATVFAAAVAKARRDHAAGGVRALRAGGGFGRLTRLTNLETARGRERLIQRVK